jgi:hypothetical protein
MTTNYTQLSLADLVMEVPAIARETQSLFGHLDQRQLNWRPDERSWSVAQCFDHLLAINRHMFQAIDAALDRPHPLPLWQRLPGLPHLLGRMLVRSQGPDGRQKLSAPRLAIPSASALDERIIDRFVAHQNEVVTRLRTLQGRDAAGVIMTSPFASFITYSVLDGCRLIVAHERRHFEQARRVTRAAGFPSTPLLS